MKQKNLLAFDIVFFVTILLLVFASAFSYRYINNLTRSADLVNHTNLVKLELEKTLSYVKDAESGVRGYVITKDSVFVGPVKEAMQKTKMALDAIRNIINDNPAQLDNIKALQVLIDKKFENLNYGLTLPKPLPKTAPNYLEGRKIMEDIRNVMNKMMAAEENLLNERESAMSRFVFLTPFFFLLFSIIALVVVIFVYARLRRENKLRTQAESNEAGMLVNRKKIEELEQRSRLAIEASAMGVFDWDLQNQQFISSPRLLEIFGAQDKPDTTHKELVNRLHPDDKPMRDKAVADSHKKGSMTYEARVIWPDNSIHWINVYGIVVFNDKQEPLRMYGSVIDVTRNKTILEELKESESKFRLLANFMTQQVWTANAEGEMNYFNQTVYDYSGVHDELNFDKVGWLNTIHPDEKNDNIKKWNYAVTNGQEFVSEHRLVDLYGKYRWHITQAVPQFDKNGIIRMWVGTSTDIQDQKDFAEELGKKVIERTERLVEKNIELKRSEDRYYSMVNEVQDYAILMLDKEGNVQNWNKGAEKIKGYKAEEIIGKNFSLFYQEEERGMNLPGKLIEEAIKDGKSENQGWRLRKDGSRFWANVVITAFYDDEKNVIGFSKVTRDLTDKRDAEERQHEYLRSIEQKNIELERSNAELQSFNYIASHDLQEPLRKIQAFSSLILDKEKSNLSQSANDYFNRINKAAQGMQNLIEALISYSQTNNTGIQIADMNMNDLLEDVQNDLSNNIEEKNAVIEYDVLPIVQADPVQFLQLFTNLLSNAIKYNRPDVQPLVKITSGIVRGTDIDEPDAVPTRAYWKISIADNGIGFDQKYEHKIFELFQRLHGKQEYQGTGIGLAICKKIMRNHDGFISATGTPGVGSVFNIFLPLRNNFY